MASQRRVTTNSGQDVEEFSDAQVDQYTGRTQSLVIGSVGALLCGLVILLPGAIMYSIYSAQSLSGDSLLSLYLAILVIGVIVALVGAVGLALAYRRSQKQMQAEQDRENSTPGTGVSNPGFNPNSCAEADAPPSYASLFE